MRRWKCQDVNPDLVRRSQLERSMGVHAPDLWNGFGNNRYCTGFDPGDHAIPGNLSNAARHLSGLRSHYFILAHFREHPAHVESAARSANLLQRCHNALYEHSRIAADFLAIRPGNPPRVEKFAV